VIELSISLLAIPVFWALNEWRVGLLLCLVTAILQDPLRKLTPDQPVFYVVFVGVVFGGMCLGALRRRISLSPNNIFKRYSQLVAPFSLFLPLVVVEAFNSFLRFGNPMIPLIGILMYLLPLPSVICAYQLVVKQGMFRVNQFMIWYIICMLLALTTVYLEFSGYHWPVLGSVGPKLIIFDKVTGKILPSNAGLFRASEIAAWHATAAACFVFLMTFSRRITLTRLLTAAIVVALLLVLGSLTGRRKSLVEFVVFVGTYFGLWIIFTKDVGKLVTIAVAGAALLGYAWLTTALPEDVVVRKSTAESQDYSHYVEHSQNAFSEIPSRFVEIGVAPVMYAYDSFGLLGAGLGVGTQGTQHFGGGGEIGAGSAEGGLGKITLELGIPGLLIIGWIAILVFRYLWQVMRVASRHSRQAARLSFGFFSFLTANVAGFSVATQAYGDLFVLLILSWMVAFLLAVPVLIEREIRARQPATAEQLTPIFRPRTV
jgi:hypothetical protein